MNMGMMTSTKEAFPAKPASITQSYKVRWLWALVPSNRPRSRGLRAPTETTTPFVG